MEENVKKGGDHNSFVFFPPLYVDAGDDISIESANRMNNAILRFGVYGELPDMEGWKQWERLIVESAIAQMQMASQAGEEEE